MSSRFGLDILSRRGVRECRGRRSRRGRVLLCLRVMSAEEIRPDKKKGLFFLFEGVRIWPRFTRNRV
jgi:hypothetical protein